MTDAELVEGFEHGILDPATFHHREHIRLTWVYLVRYGREDAERRLLEGLRALAIRAGKPDRFDAPLTIAWVAAIDAARVMPPGISTFDALIDRHAELLDRTSVHVSR